MDNVNDDAKVEFRRVELLTGPARRRRWSAQEKAQIVSETLEPDARVSEVARRWQVCPQQVFGWRRAMRLGGATKPAGASRSAAPGFVPIVTEAMAVEAAPRLTREATIEIELAGAVVRVGPGMEDTKRLTAVLRAVRAAGLRP